MKIIVDDMENLEEIRISDVVRSQDAGRVILDNTGLGSKEKRADEVKEIIANDALEVGLREAGRIHGVPYESVRSYANGEDIKDEDVKTRILAKKNNIADVATAKLMESLNLFDPNAIEKQKDLVSAASQLASIVDKLNGSGKSGEGQIVVNFYNPGQGKMKDYPVIDV